MPAQCYPTEADMKSLVKLADPDEEDLEGGMSGFLLYNNRTVCADGFKISAAIAMCRLLGYSSTRRWKARETKGIYEINMGNLVCDGQDAGTCSFRNLEECVTDSAAFLYCTGFCN